MIILTWTADEEMKEFAVDKVEVTCSEEGRIEDYVKAFNTFLHGVGFAEGTIAKALPNFNPNID